jgi:hypothetical protein
MHKDTPSQSTKGKVLAHVPGFRRCYILRGALKYKVKRAGKLINLTELRGAVAHSRGSAWPVARLQLGAAQLANTQDK